MKELTFKSEYDECDSPLYKKNERTCFYSAYGRIFRSMGCPGPSRAEVVSGLGYVVEERHHILHGHASVMVRILGATLAVVIPLGRYQAKVL